MKKCISILSAVVILMTCMLTNVTTVHASTKLSQSRAIAIVFDNSGSMYIDGDKMAWCRATYAMEVFASMLNSGDVLQIYPMWPITVSGKTYTMEQPLVIKDASQASLIREICTDDPRGTPIESIDCAVEGLKKVKADKKYVIVLTDGDIFYENNKALSKHNTAKELDERIQANAGEAMSIMYLGIGTLASIPETPESEYFIKRKASDTADVLSTLTEMCNKIFGRDTLPENHISGKNIDFDISMSKLIIFVQGENISNLKIKGDSVGKLDSSQQTKYSVKGSERYKDEEICDDSLQGMIVTYTDCGAGEYTIEYSGTATSIEVYYEPDADLDFVFTDADGNAVDPNALYEGDYIVSFGMKDAKTGKLCESDLLGQPKYNGSYYINGKEYPITCDGYSGAEKVTLSVGDTFTSDLMVTYLSGYTISKNSTDFNWPEFGITILPRPAEELKVEISGGEEIYYLREFETGAPYILKAYYDGDLLNANEYDLSLSGNTGNAEFDLIPNGDHYEIAIKHADPSNIESTKVGTFNVTANVKYAEKGSEEANASKNISYRIDDVRPSGALRIEISGGQESYSLQYLEDGEAFIAKIYYEDSQLTGDALKQVELEWNLDQSNATIVSEFADDHYVLKLQHKDPEKPENTACGECTVDINASYTPEGYDEAKAQGTLTYEIKDDLYLLTLDVQALENYIVIKDLAESEEIIANVELNGQPLTPEEFAMLTITVDCEKINYTVTPNPTDSSFAIKLLETEKISEGNYDIDVTVVHTDNIGRTVSADDSENITLSNIPLWVRWAVGLLLLLIIIIIVWIILHIKVLPKYMHTTRRLSTMTFDGDDVSQSTNFLAEIKKKGAKIQSQYAGRKIGISMDVTPGRESYLYKPQKRRSAVAKVTSVKKFGSAKIQEVMIGSVKFIMDDSTGKLVPAIQNQKPFPLTNGMMVKYSGTMQDAGIDKDFEVTSKLDFKKK